MKKVMATYRGGAVVFDSPVDWPDGTRIEVVQFGTSETNGARVAPGIRPELLLALNDPERYGLDEALWPQTPQEIEVLLRHMDEAEPLRMTDAERSAMDADHLAEKERQKEFTRQSWSEAENRFE